MASYINVNLFSMQLVGFLMILPLLIVSGEETKPPQPNKAPNNAKPFIGLLEGGFPKSGDGGPLDVIAKVGHAVGNIFNNLFSDPQSKIPGRSRSQGSLDTPRPGDVEMFTPKSPVSKFFKGIFGIGRKERKNKNSKTTPQRDSAGVTSSVAAGENNPVPTEEVTAQKSNPDEVTTPKQEDAPVTQAPDSLQSSQSEVAESQSEVAEGENKAEAQEGDSQQ